VAPALVTATVDHLVATPRTALEAFLFLAYTRPEQSATARPELIASIPATPTCE
jgi:hypothetical protein